MNCRDSNRIYQQIKQHHEILFYIDAEIAVTNSGVFINLEYKLPNCLLTDSSYFTQTHKGNTLFPLKSILKLFSF